MASEQIVPDFKKDTEYRKKLVVLEDLKKNMATIIELGGSVNKEDRVMVSHISTSHSAAIRENILRTVLDADQHANEDAYWQQVARYDDSDQQETQH